MASTIFANRYIDNKSDSNIEIRQTTLVGLAKNVNANDKVRKSNPSEISRRNIRERLIHLLALKEFDKSELYSRLKKEGISEHERSSITSILMDIALPRNHMYSLRAHMWHYVNENWPFYTEHERDQVKRNKPQDITPPHRPNNCSSFGSQSPINTPADSPPQQTESLEHEYPPPSKKRRISHIATKVSHPTKRDSSLQVNGSTSNNSAVYKSNNDEKPKHQKTQQQRDLPKKSESQAESTSLSTRKKYRMSDLFGENTVSPLRAEYKSNTCTVTKSDKRDVKSLHKNNNFADNIVQKTCQSQLDLPKKCDSLTVAASPATNKTQTMSELLEEDFGTPVKGSSDHKTSHKSKKLTKSLTKKCESLLTSLSAAIQKMKSMAELFEKDSVSPAKRSTSKHKSSHKRKRSTDLNLQLETQPQPVMAKSIDNLITSVYPATRKTQRMIELFGEDSD